MTTRIIILLLASLLIASCATAKKPDRVGEKEHEILYIYPDGTMEFRGRIKNKEDVVIYEDGRGNELAAIKIIVPRNSDYYRDNLTVERIEIDVPIVREN
ncbi:MAG: hypothetical protein IIA77_00785 [Proteobacteria bacterium]|nr:hypothetical protein [Pseudomonadota bacterium]